ncbi:hypothetical protein NXZ75_13565 [Lysinibacillus sphaericus]|uniref:hypothetical protein n=2 Tax=Lysinibacillus sphaericus TaxID=1421 RepID=UPI002163C66B|nr:hypothetical protein [Lysinibacillus sphaericus]MCS1383229.1 hypothetical protein [Lysinibacillus sphaericus]
MNIMRNSDLLSDSEIMDLLDGSQRTIKSFNKEELTETARAILRESLEKSIEIYKQNKDFGSVETFSNILCNFESLKFYLEFDHENSIAYSFECNKETEHYALKDSGFFTLLK